MAFGLGAALALTGAVAASPQALAQAAAAPAAAVPAPVAVAEPAAAKAAAPAANDNTADAYVPAKPVAGVGQPTARAYGFQTQFSPVGHEALAMHNAILMPIIVAITLFVLGLMLYVMVRFRRASNPVASKNAHNTVIEVVWTLLPVLILVFVAVPSIRLLAAQYKAPPKSALTVKVTGYQWYWGYTYPDNGGFEVISNMLTPEEALKRGEPQQLGADKRMVVPAGEPIRLQTTGSDVIHAFAVPSLWFKLDAVPGKINERLLFIEKPGVYYGQCSELCGARHGFMPIAIEAVSRPVFNAWLKANGGTVASSKDAKPAAAAPTAATAAPAPAVDASAKPAA
jgi:cytochrome c oxidase subunit 2